MRASTPSTRQDIEAGRPVDERGSDGAAPDKAPRVGNPPNANRTIRTSAMGQSASGDAQPRSVRSRCSAAFDARTSIRLQPASLRGNKPSADALATQKSPPSRAGLRGLEGAASADHLDDDLAHFGARDGARLRLPGFCLLRGDRCANLLWRLPRGCGASVGMLFHSFLVASQGSVVATKRRARRRCIGVERTECPRREPNRRRRGLIGEPPIGRHQGRLKARLERRRRDDLFAGDVTPRVVPLVMPANVPIEGGSNAWSVT